MEESIYSLQHICLLLLRHSEKKVIIAKEYIWHVFPYLDFVSLHWLFFLISAVHLWFLLPYSGCYYLIWPTIALSWLLSCCHWSLSLIIFFLVDFMAPMPLSQPWNLVFYIALHVGIWHSLSPFIIEYGSLSPTYMLTCNLVNYSHYGFNYSCWFILQFYIASPLVIYCSLSRTFLEGTTNLLLRFFIIEFFGLQLITSSDYLLMHH